MEESDMNFLDVCELTKQVQQGSDISPDFLASPWYRDIVYVIKNLQAPPELTGAKARSIKLKSSRYCILNGYLYWKDPGGILLNCLLETKVKEKISEFHKKDCGGHLYWKTIAYKLLIAGFYWPIFSQMYTKRFPPVINARYLREKEGLSLFHLPLL